MQTIFIDLDGVLVDLHGGVAKFGFSFPKEQTPETRIITNKLFDDIHHHETFWSDLPAQEDKHILIEFLKTLDNEQWVLSASPEGYGHDHRHDHCSTHKKLWCVKNDIHVPYDKMIITKSKLKQNVISEMKLIRPILIDDHMSNIKRWEKAGGVGIHHKNAEKTIEKLKRELCIDWLTPYVFGDRNV